MSLQDELLPIRMLNEFEYCPRLFWLEHVDGVFVDNEHTVAGSHAHRRVDKPGGRLGAPSSTAIAASGPTPASTPTPALSAAPSATQAGAQARLAESAVSDGEANETTWHSRALWLSCATLGVSGKLDAVEGSDGVTMPVDTKVGRPDPGGGLWPSDAIQLALQGLLLRAHGYVVTHVACYYLKTRRRVKCELDDVLVERAKRVIRDAQKCMAGRERPRLLVDSPKCFGCSLNIVCLPDETNRLLQAQAKSGDTRRVVPARDDALPVYVQDHGARVGKSGSSLVVTTRQGEKSLIGIPQTSQLNIFGSAQVTTQAVRACLRAGIPVAWFSGGGWFDGMAEPGTPRQVEVRIAQYDRRETPRALEIARVLISDKIANQRTLLRRSTECGKTLLRDLKVACGRAADAESASSLLGIEGNAARLYWPVFSKWLRTHETTFAMQGRTRRPPEDETNAMLSFGYALLVKDCVLAARACGLDPQLGVYHTAHHGRPSMALDLMEPFRPLVVDSMVAQLVARREVAPRDFVRTGQAVAMKPGARKALVRAYERRMDELVTHPVFGYRISYRRVLHVQARLLARTLQGELPALPGFRTR